MTHLNRNLVSYDNYGDIRIEENGKKLFWVKKLTGTINKTLFYNKIFINKKQVP